jgi:hypothetical protein
MTVWRRFRFLMQRNVEKFDVRYSGPMARHCRLFFRRQYIQQYVQLPPLLGNERLVLSVAHVNASLNISKRALVYEFA